jgi:type I restriction enzyme S subunit
MAMLNKNDFSKLVFEFPKKQEQQKIANCLSTIDELISTQTEKIATLKAHKKGLMQQLFVNEDINEK